MKKVLSGLLSLCAWSALAAPSPWVNIEVQNGVPVLPITINKQPSFAVLNTGMAFNALNQRFVEESQPNIKKSEIRYVAGAFHKNVQHHTYNNVEIGLLNSHADFDQLVGVKLENPKHSLVLGAPFFQNLIIQLDYTNQRIRLIPEGSVNVSPHENIKTETQKGSGQPIVQVEADGHKLWLEIDTGYKGGILVERKVARASGWIKEPATTELFQGITSVGKLDKASIKTLKFGPVSLEGVELHFPSAGQQAYIESQHSSTGSMLKGKRVVGRIGYDVLKHFVLTLDHRQGHLHLGFPEDK